MEMLERVARAIADNHLLVSDGHYTMAAQAIMQAMCGGSTSDMQVAGWKKAQERDAILGNGEIAMIFDAMIQAALSTTQPDGA